jgi:hypothetical protein
MKRIDNKKIIKNKNKSVFHVVENISSPEMCGEIVRITMKETLKSKPFLRKNENVHLYVAFEEHFDLFEGQRIILRNNTKTIGFGYVMFT